VLAGRALGDEHPAVAIEKRRRDHQNDWLRQVLIPRSTKTRGSS
jgi:hypothetical protein